MLTLAANKDIISILFGDDVLQAEMDDAYGGMAMIEYQEERIH